MYHSPMSKTEPSKEERILSALRGVLIDVIKDTTTDPRLKHPLCDDTITGIRNALELITVRQSELAQEAGRPMTDRPHYADEPVTSVKVNLDLPDKN